MKDKEEKAEYQRFSLSLSVFISCSAPKEKKAWSAVITAELEQREERRSRRGRR